MSTRYNTGNPIESTDVRDMSDNAKNFDEFSNSVSNSFTDRLGRDRQTIEGSIRKAGFQPASFDFVTGGTLVSVDRNKAVFNPAPSGDNNWYAWQGSLPKVIPAGSTPATSGGLGENAWKPVTNNILAPTVRESIRRSYAEAGYDLVDGSFKEGATLDSATSVALDDGSGIAYSGSGPYPQTVDPDTDPTIGGFVDRSGELLTHSLTSFSGTLTPSAEWSNMPAHDSPFIGEQLDVQAQVALDRTEFLKEQIDAYAPADIHIDPARRYFGPSGMVIESTDGSISGDAFIVRDDVNLRWIMYFFRGTGASIEVRYKTLAYATGLTGTWSDSVLVPSLAGYHKLVFLVDDEGTPVTVGGLYHAYVTFFSGTLASKVVYHATASSLTGPWTVGANILPRGEVGSKDEFNTDTPYAIYRDGTVHLWYMGAPAASLPTYGFATRILKATSSDPAGPFTKDYNDVILPGINPGEWDYGWLGGVQIRRRTDGRYMMVFNAGDTRPIGAGQEPATSRIGYAYADSLDGPWAKDYSNPYVSPVGTDTGVLENTNVWRGHLAYDHNYGRWSMFYNSGAATEKITRADMGAYGYTDSVTETQITGLLAVVPNSKVNLPAGRFKVSYQINVIGDTAGGVPNLDVDLYLRRNSVIIEQSRVFVGSYPYESSDAILSYIVNMPTSGYVDIVVIASGGTILPGSKLRMLRIAIEQIH